MGQLTDESVNRSTSLLGPGDPLPVNGENLGARSPFLLVCDHAGREVPHSLGRLGVPAAEFERHIAYDIGALGLARALAARLDAGLIWQPYSRLVIDCNRDPGRADAMPQLADGARVAANLDLDQAGRARRVAAIHRPYHQAIAAALDRRAAQGLETALVLIHSFTPVMAGVTRPWRVGVLHQDNPLSLAMLDRLNGEPGLAVGDNEPYAMDDVDYTAPVHAKARGLEYLELETRQDLIGEADGQARYADLYARLIPAAWADVRRGA